MVILQDGVRVAGATVTFNGVDAPPHPIDDTHYNVSITASAGDLVELVATYDDILIVGACMVAGEIVPVSPNMTDGPYDATQSIPVAWTATSFVPEKVRLAVTGWDTVSGEDTFITYDGAATDAEIPGGVVRSGRLVPCNLTALNETSILTVVAQPGSPPVRLVPGSYFEARWNTSWIEFETQ
jgi:hypothetical protein